jgi:hypothetical protein
MSQVTAEDERKIREKYGDLLDNIEAEREPLTGEQCLALLPPEAPRSGSIFTSGFYFNGRGIKYRTNLGEALIPYCNHSGVNFLNCLGKFLMGATAVYSFISGKWLFFLFSFLVGYIDIIENVFTLTLSPYAEIDLNNKVIRSGRFFITKIPFSEIEYIERFQLHAFTYGPRAGTTISCCPHKVQNQARIAVLHTWEETDNCIEIITKSLMCLLGKDLQTKYIKIPEDLISAQRGKFFTWRI